MHRAGLDPAELSERELAELYQEHRELQRQLAQRLEQVELLIGSAVTPGGVEAWEAFEVEGDALVSSHLR